MFLTRYVDLFTTFYSVYNTIMKLVYIGASAWIVWMIRREKPFVATYEVRFRWRAGSAGSLVCWFWSQLMAWRVGSSGARRTPCATTLPVPPQLTLTTRSAVPPSPPYRRLRWTPSGTSASRSCRAQCWRLFSTTAGGVGITRGRTLCLRCESAMQSVA